MEKEIRDIGHFYYHYPQQVVVVTSCWGDRENAMAAAWHAPISFQPPLYGVSISPRRSSYRLILESKQFAINFLPLEKAELVVASGATKGDEVDKFQAFHIERDKGAKTGVPILKEAYAAYECRLFDHRTYGDHEWFVGEVVSCYLHPPIITPQQTLDIEKVNPLLYLGADIYTTTAPQSRRYIDRQPFRNR